jgi:hypothetical protein
VPELVCQNESLRGAAETHAPRFTCYLDDYPDHLIAGRYLNLETDARYLVVNPDLIVARLEDLPVGMLHPSLLDNFQPGEDMVWIPRAGVAMTDFFWLRTKLGESISRLTAGEIRASDLSSDKRAVLQLAGVLIDGRGPAGNLEEQQQNLRSSAVQFQQRGYAPVAGLVHPLHVAALRKYYRKLIRRGALKRGDSQSDRYIAHNERVAKLFHHQLTPAISAIVGEAVKPSYVYAASYQSGARLEKHVDREQCEFSLTFCLDYSPEPCLHTPWPIELHTGSSVVTVYQGLGDGLVYRGRVIPHSRETLPRGHTSTSVFFHYVREDFEGPLD